MMAEEMERAKAIARRERERAEARQDTASIRYWRAAMELLLLGDVLTAQRILDAEADGVHA